MNRIERTEIFGHHVICATACRLSHAGPRARWKVRVSAVELGAGMNEPMLQFPASEREDAAAAMDAAIQNARNELAAARRPW